MTAAGGRRQAAGGRRDNIKVWRDTARGEIKVSKPVMTAGPLTQIKIRTPGARTPVKIASLKQTHRGRRMGYLRRPFLRHVCFERYTGDAFERASPYDRGCACSREGRNTIAFYRFFLSAVPTGAVLFLFNSIEIDVPGERLISEFSHSLAP